MTWNVLRAVCKCGKKLAIPELAPNIHYLVECPCGRLYEVFLLIHRVKLLCPENVNADDPQVRRFALLEIE